MRIFKVKWYYFKDVKRVSGIQGLVEAMQMLITDDRYIDAHSNVAKQIINDWSNFILHWLSTYHIEV